MALTPALCFQRLLSAFCFPPSASRLLSFLHNSFPSPVLDEVGQMRTPLVPHSTRGNGAGESPEKRDVRLNSEPQQLGPVNVAPVT